jgi:alkaline phosphatase
MSIPTVTAARIYKGQKKRQTGEEENLTFDKFPYGALSRVIKHDKIKIKDKIYNI